MIENTNDDGPRRGAPPAWRDPVLGEMLRQARARLSVPAKELAAAAWELGIPLSCTEVHRVEAGRRHPTPWYLHAWMEVLALRPRERKALVERWALSPRWADVTWDSWRQFLADLEKPVPVTRRARSGRLRSTGRRVAVGSAFKLRLTDAEDALVRKSAQFFGVTISDLVRDAVSDAVAQRRKAKPVEATGPRTRDHNIRLGLTPDAVQAIRAISYGLELAPWVRLIVLDDLQSGRATKRYKTLRGVKATAVKTAPAAEPVEAS